MGEWWDNTRILYGYQPLGLCEHCDGFGAEFTVQHGLSCKKGGLVGIWHNDVRDEAGALADLALKNGKVTYKPQIYYGKDISATGPAQQANRGLKRGETC